MLKKKKQKRKSGNEGDITRKGERESEIAYFAHSSST
jgi:hypothetical protein